MNTGQVRRNKARWRSWAESNDRYARMTIPVLYAMVLIWLFYIDLTDDYESATGRVTGSWSRG